MAFPDFTVPLNEIKGPLLQLQGYIDPISVPFTTSGSILFSGGGTTIFEDNPRLFWDSTNHQQIIRHNGGSAIARTDAALELQSSDGPQLSLFVTTNPALNNATEASIGSFAYDSAGTIVKVGSFSNQFLDRTHGSYTAKTRLYGCYGTGQNDNALTIYGNHGIGLFEDTTVLANTPGAGVLRISGSLTIPAAGSFTLGAAVDDDYGIKALYDGTNLAANNFIDHGFFNAAGTKGVILGHDSASQLGTITAAGASSGLSFYTHNGSTFTERVMIGKGRARSDASIETLAADSILSLFQTTNPGNTTNESGIAFMAYNSASTISKTASISSPWGSANSSTGYGILRFTLGYAGGASESVLLKLYGNGGVRINDGDNVTPPGTGILYVGGDTIIHGLLKTGTSPITLTNAAGELIPVAIHGYPANATKYLDGDGNWSVPSGSFSGANTNLSNLASVSINSTLLAQTDIDLGSTTKPFRNLFLFGGGTYGTNYFEITGTPTGIRVLTLPNVSGILVTGGGTASGTNTGDQTNISGNASTVTTNANLTGPITSVGNSTSIASQTGTGIKFVMDTSPVISGGSHTGITSFGIRDTSAAFDVTIATTSSTTLTAGRTLTVDIANASRTLKLTGNPTLADWFDQGVKTTSSPTFSAVTANGGAIKSQLDGSDSVASGAFYDLSNASGNRQWLIQLSGSNNIDYWYFNGSSWTKTITFFNSGCINVGSPTGTDKGAGAINAVTVWRNGTSLDSVFEPDYKLLTIDEMSSYYLTHKHLPTIPTEKVHKEGSTDIGALEDRLWETVEVQAIYITELHNRIKILESRVLVA